jgi:hypothetical protein
MAMSMGYHRYQSQQTEGGDHPLWVLFCAIVAIGIALMALPWIILGFIAQRPLARWLHWRLCGLIWFTLLFVGAYLLYTSYQHGLASMIDQELTDYFRDGLHYQLQLDHYPWQHLWSETWQVWFQTWPAFGIAGLVAELYANLHTDTVRTLHQQEQRREQKAQREQRKARKRTARPKHLPDSTSGMMVMGVPINDEKE